VIALLVARVFRIATIPVCFSSLLSAYSIRVISDIRRAE
jgi:hypothetical protein